MYRHSNSLVRSLMGLCTGFVLVYFMIGDLVADEIRTTIESSKVLTVKQFTSRLTRNKYKVVMHMGYNVQYDHSFLVYENIKSIVEASNDKTYHMVFSHIEKIESDEKDEYDLVVSELLVHLLKLRIQKPGTKVVVLVPWSSLEKLSDEDLKKITKDVCDIIIPVDTATPTNNYVYNTLTIHDQKVKAQDSKSATDSKGITAEDTLPTSLTIAEILDVAATNTYNSPDIYVKEGSFDTLQNLLYTLSNSLFASSSKPRHYNVYLQMNYNGIEDRSDISRSVNFIQAASFLSAKINLLKRIFGYFTDFHMSIHNEYPTAYHELAPETPKDELRVNDEEVTPLSLAYINRMRKLNEGKAHMRNSTTIKTPNYNVHLFRNDETHQIIVLVTYPTSKANELFVRWQLAVPSTSVPPLILYVNNVAFPIPFSQQHQLDPGTSGFYSVINLKDDSDISSDGDEDEDGEATMMEQLMESFSQNVVDYEEGEPLNIRLVENINLSNGRSFVYENPSTEKDSSSEDEYEVVLDDSSDEDDYNSETVKKIEQLLLQAINNAKNLSEESDKAQASIVKEASKDDSLKLNPVPSSFTRSVENTDLKPLDTTSDNQLDSVVYPDLRPSNTSSNNPVNYSSDFYTVQDPKMVSPEQAQKTKYLQYLKDIKDIKAEYDEEDDEEEDYEDNDKQGTKYTSTTYQFISCILFNRSISQIATYTLFEAEIYQALAVMSLKKMIDYSINPKYSTTYYAGKRTFKTTEEYMDHLVAAHEFWLSEATDAMEVASDKLNKMKTPRTFATEKVIQSIKKCSDYFSQDESNK